MIGYIEGDEDSLYEDMKLRLRFFKKREKKS